MNRMVLTNSSLLYPYSNRAGKTAQGGGLWVKAAELGREMLSQNPKTMAESLLYQPYQDRVKSKKYQSQQLKLTNHDWDSESSN